MTGARTNDDAQSNKITADEQFSTDDPRRGMNAAERTLGTTLIAAGIYLVAFRTQEGGHGQKSIEPLQTNV